MILKKIFFLIVPFGIKYVVSGSYMGVGPAMGESGLNGQTLSGLCNCLPSEICQSNKQNIAKLIQLVNDLKMLKMQGASATQCSMMPEWNINPSQFSSGGTECLDIWANALNPFSILDNMPGMNNNGQQQPAKDFNVCETFQNALSNLLALKLSGVHNILDDHRQKQQCAPQMNPLTGAGCAQNMIMSRPPMNSSCSSPFGGSGQDSSMGGFPSGSSGKCSVIRSPSCPGGNSLLKLFGLGGTGGCEPQRTQGMSMLSGLMNNGGQSSCGSGMGGMGQQSPCSSGMGGMGQSPCSSGMGGMGQQSPCGSGMGFNMWGSGNQLQLPKIESEAMGQCNCDGGSGMGGMSQQSPCSSGMGGMGQQSSCGLGMGGMGGMGQSSCSSGMGGMGQQSSCGLGMGGMSQSPCSSGMGGMGGMGQQSSCGSGMGGMSQSPCSNTPNYNPFPMGIMSGMGGMGNSPCLSSINSMFGAMAAAAPCPSTTPQDPCDELLTTKIPFLESLNEAFAPCSSGCSSGQVTGASPFCSTC
ncbi:hypothetical protein NEFER03_0366 [Nematocida sp. LUAm3]|nr:hypothetical protein NEFER03_0366 [Nematocida sp. LUAm3]KAI5176018.1 hypothetical protein NEFER02_1864 [Nematocida sp. LUAm2]KAI5179115.1 hypothetical protein NEFER01_1982 [Nematocida sp. LUAm1]